jgi:hypothetical protein
MKTFTVKAWVIYFLFCLVTNLSLAGAADWRSLSPKEKDKIQRNYQRWEKLPPQDKEHLREEWDRWQRLPQDERDRLRQRYDDQRRRRND